MSADDLIVNPCEPGLFQREMPSDALIVIEGGNGMANAAWQALVRKRPGGGEVCAKLRVRGWYGDCTSLDSTSFLSGKRLGAFWKYAERLDCWNLTDWSDTATDLSVYDLFLRRGPRSLRITCYGFTGESPQAMLVTRIQRLTGIDALWKRAQSQRVEQ
jgi:hypothetical protein